MSVWHQVNLMIYPPIQNCQSSEWTLHFSMQSMRAHAKQSTNRKISGNVSVTPQLIGKYKEMSVWHQVNLTIYPPYIWQSTEWSLHCSMLSLALKDRYTPPPTLADHRVISSLFKVVTETLRQIYPPVFRAANHFNC